MTPRASKEYLLGVDASNIYFTWDPDTNDVIRHRDLRFDESQRFTGERPWVAQLVRSHVPPPAQIQLQEPDEDSSDDEFLRRSQQDENSSSSDAPAPPQDLGDRSRGATGASTQVSPFLTLTSSNLMSSTPSSIAAWTSSSTASFLLDLPDPATALSCSWLFTAFEAHLSCGSKTSVRNYGLFSVSDDSCVYSNGRIIVLFYVDDNLMYTS